MKSKKLVTFDMVSADGCFTDAEAKLDWVIPNEDVNRAAMEAAPHVDTMLFGRKTFEMFEHAWRDKDVDPHSGKTTPQSRDMSKWINDHVKLVVSKTMKEPTWKSSRLLKDADRSTIESLKKSDGGDIIVFGSGQLVAHLTDLGAIDEYVFAVNPVFVGKGRSLLDGLEQPTKLTLVDERRFVQTGHVLLRYRRASV